MNDSMRETRMRHSGQQKTIRAGIFVINLPYYRIPVYNLMVEEHQLDVTVFSPPLSGPALGHRQLFAHREIRVFTFPMPQRLVKNPPKYESGLLSSIIRRRFDVFVMVDDVVRLSAWAALLLKYVFKHKVCIWGHGFSRPDTWIRRSLRGLMLKLADSVIFYTDGVRQQWIARGVDSRKLFVATNALDTRIADKLIESLTNDELADFRAAEGLSGKNVIVFIGRLQARKKLHVLVKAMKSVVAQAPETVAVIVGEGPEEERLRTLVRELALEKNVLFKGVNFEEEINAKYLLSAVAMAVPAAGGLAIQHAFGYGVPVVLGDAMGAHGPEAELMEAGQTGLFCRDDDPEDLARALLKLVHDPQLRQRMGRNCRKIIQEQYNIINMAQGAADAVKYAAGMASDASCRQQQCGTEVMERAGE